MSETIPAGNQEQIPQHLLIYHLTTKPKDASYCPHRLYEKPNLWLPCHPTVIQAVIQPDQPGYTTFNRH